MRIVEISEKGRDAIELFEDAVSDRDTVSLAALVDRSLDNAAEAFPGVAFEAEPPDANVVVPDALSVVVNNLIENAAAHNDGEQRRVRVGAAVDDGDARVWVADNGPGIDDYELNVLNAGTETALQHGSGLGLWLVKWGTELLGGSVSFEPNEPTGTVVTATIPLERVDRRSYAPRRR